MKNIILSFTKQYIRLIIFLFPLFFLPITQEYFATNKLYFLIFATLFILVLLSILLLEHQKISFSYSIIDIYAISFILLLSASTLIQTTNKISSILSKVYGLGIIAPLFIIYLTTKNLKIQALFPLFLSGVALSIITIVLSFNPFQNTILPNYLKFLESPVFTPIGNQFDLAIFIGYLLVILFTEIFIHFSKKALAEKLLAFSISAVFIIILAISVFKTINPPPAYVIVGGKKTTIEGQKTILAPFSISWYTVIETLKSPKTILFGAGPNNFGNIFTLAKTFQYNRTELWNYNFLKSRSALLHIWTESGILSFIAFCGFIISALKFSYKSRHEDAPTLFVGLLYLVAVLMFFPISIIVFFMLFVHISHISQLENNEKKIYINIKELPVIYSTLSFTGIAIALWLGFFLSKSYASELAYKQSLDYIYANNAQKAYKNLQKAIQLNPYDEKLRIKFSQLNLTIANSIASKKEITDKDRKAISEAIQVAINNAKIAVVLNPNYAPYWENLAIIYRNIIGIAKGADIWAISTYQKSISLDPKNPSLRLSLGGIYYQIKDYNNAIQLFSDAVRLKPDIPNYFYNLAWAYYKAGKYTEANNAMENVLKLLKDKKSRDYKKASKELSEFKKKLTSQTQSKEIQKEYKTEELSLPKTTTEQQISPPIILPKNAEPPYQATKEAKMH